MSKDTFTWHADQDDDYDGDIYGSTTLEGLPFTAFNKDIGKSFTMDGDDEDTLTLAPTPGGYAVWGASVPSELDVSEFNINGGTLAIQSQGGTLNLGAIQAHKQLITLNIAGTFLARQTTFIGTSRGVSPWVTFKVFPRGRCSISEGVAFNGAFLIEVDDLGSMSVTACGFNLEHGQYFASGIGNADNPSLELIASPSLAQPGSGYFEMTNQQIVCSSRSVSRLQAKAMSLTDSTMRAADTASLLIACDTIDFAGRTQFTVGQGSAAITFSGSAKNAAPFDFFKNSYPKGLFNFITNEGTNKSTFRFLNIGSAYDFKKMQTDGIITTYDLRKITKYLSEPSGSDLQSHLDCVSGAPLMRDPSRR